MLLTHQQIPGKSTGYTHTHTHHHWHIVLMIARSFHGAKLLVFGNLLFDFKRRHSNVRRIFTTMKNTLSQDMDLCVMIQTRS